MATADVTSAEEDSAVDLESVAVHEIGHLLGLGHSSSAEAVMYPSLRTKTRKVELMRDDVEGIQGLYGGNPNYAVETKGSSSPETSSQVPATATVSAILTAAVAAATTLAGFVLKECVFFWC